MNDYNTAVGGWVCSYCRAWVPPGAYHSCMPYQNGQVTGNWGKLPIDEAALHRKLDRIIHLLEIVAGLRARSSARYLEEWEEEE